MKSLMTIIIKIIKTNFHVAITTKNTSIQVSNIVLQVIAGLAGCNKFMNTLDSVKIFLELPDSDNLIDDIEPKEETCAGFREMIRSHRYPDFTRNSEENSLLLFIAL